jgi:predicted nucleic acid-binding protein
VIVLDASVLANALADDHHDGAQRLSKATGPRCSITLVP